MSRRDDNQCNNEVNVIVDEGGVLARWADWQGKGKQAPVAAISGEGETPMMFVENEVLVGSEERDLADELVNMGATMVPQMPLQPPPHGLEGRQLNGEFPMPFRLQFAEPPRVERPLDRLTDLYRRHDAKGGQVTVSSEGAARVAALVGRLVAEGREIGLNTLGNSTVMPLASAQEDPGQAGGSNPFAWQAFSGRSRIVQAWQLIESVRAVGSVEPVVWIAILDGGFWLDSAGVPLIAAGQTASDFGGGVLQINLLDEKGANASGTNPNKCRNSSCPWHGNAVASAAVAAVNNGAGAAGSGGTVGRPIFFRPRISEDQVYRCLQYCTAWGIDILNMSFSMPCSELLFATSTWDKAFNFAAAHGVVMVASAGNDNKELPDYNVRPATRTPGVITVGAFDPNYNAAGFSNYGSSINVWAPGVNIPVAPDGNPGNTNGSLQSGTSLASPIVAGVAAMMRAVNPSLDSVAVRQILVESGWQGTGRVTKGLDAYSAVLKALGGTLPKDLSESNNTPGTAKELFPVGPGGSLQPLFGGFAARSGSVPDYYKFQVTEFSTVTIKLEWYQLLSKLSLLLESVDLDNRGPGEMSRVSSATTGTTTLQGLLAAGSYRILIGGTADTAYRLNVTRQPAQMPQDMFEPNDSFETATKMIFEPRKGRFGVFRLEWGPGTFEATLHAVRAAWVMKDKASAWLINPDYYELDVPESSVFRIPTITIANTDLPLDVTLYDSARKVIQIWSDVRIAEVKPPGNTTCYLKVSGNSVNRYTINARLKVDKHAIPGPLQEELEIFPKWWGDPEPLRIFEREKFFAINVGEDRGDGTAIIFAQPEESVRIELLDLAGNIVSEAKRTPKGVLIDTNGIAPDRYLVRIKRELSTARATRPLNLRLLSPQ